MTLPLALTVSAGVAFAHDLRRTFEVFQDTHTGEVNTAPGLAMYLVALIPSTIAAIIGYLGRKPDWQYNRRFQRAFLGSISAAGLSVFIGTLALTLARAAGESPDYGAAMFGTICALAYGAVCAAVTPPDRIDDPEESE